MVDEHGGAGMRPAGAAAAAGCPFCTVASEQIWLANAHAFAIPDAYPLTEGHMLVIPRAHHASVFDGSDVEVAALWALVGAVRARLQRELAPDGFTVGVNDGVAAGQTVMHGHVHVIPRRLGDVPAPAGGIRWILPERAAYWLPRPLAH
jgi:diadenosine tetraphosphate (Ap4A) HIT family hydrolase